MGDGGETGARRDDWRRRWLKTALFAIAVAGVLGTGMYDVHSVRESVSLDDLVRTAELLVEIVRLHAEEQPVG